MKENVRNFVPSKEKILFNATPPKFSLGGSFFWISFANIILFVMMFFCLYMGAVVGDFKDILFDDFVKQLFLWTFIVVLLLSMLIGGFVVAASNAIQFVLTDKGIYKIFGIAIKQSIFIPYSKITRVVAMNTFRGELVRVNTSGINVLDIYVKKDSMKLKQLIERKMK